MARSLLPLTLMNVSLYQAASALSANSRWQEIIADNMASGSIAGYKRQQLSMSAIQAGLMPASGLNANGSSPMFVMPKAMTGTNFTAGSLKATGVNTDAAIEGKGFFNVQLPNGSTGYTRNGEFQIDTQGQLMTKEGFPVLGEGGPIKLNPRDTSPMTISTTGEVNQGSQLRGKLALTEFDKPGALTQLNGGYFTNDKSTAQTKAATSTVRQGYLESSNSSTVLEMANLMTAMRGFEANQHVIQIQDDRLGKTIADLGSPT